MVGTIPEDGYTTLDRKQISSFATSPQAIAAFESLQLAAFLNNPAATTAAQGAADAAAADAATAQGAAVAAAADAASRQPSSANLTGISSLDAVLGLVEQVSTSGFTKRLIGVVNATDIPTRADADARFVAKGTGATWATPSGTLTRTTFAAYAGQTVSNPPTQAQMQALDDHVKILSQRLAALITDMLAKAELP